MKKIIEDVMHSQNATVFYDIKKDIMRMIVNKNGKLYITKYYSEEELMRVMGVAVSAITKEAIEEYSIISKIPHDLIGTIFFLEDTVAKSI